MKKITIEGKFTGPVNNFVVLEVFRPNALSNPYDFRKSYNDDFKETFKDLHPDTTYNVDLAGFTTTEFSLKISGEIEVPNPITSTFQETSFNPGFVIQTNA